MNSLQSWCSKWKLKLNADKCVGIHFTHSLPSCQPSLTINNTKIEFVSSHRDLGVRVTNNLSWSIHYNHICSKAYAALNLIRRMFTTSSINVKKQLYLLLVRSQFTYCPQLWRPHLLKDITHLKKQKHRATKCIVQDRNQDYKSRLISLQLLRLMYWFELLDIMFLVKCIKQPDKLIIQYFLLCLVLNFQHTLWLQRQ